MHAQKTQLFSHFLPQTEMTTLLRLLLFLTFCKFVLFCVQGWGYIGEKNVHVFTNCGVVSCCVHFLRSVASRPRTPTTCLFCRLKTFRNLSCSFMFKICAFHSCSKYGTPIFVALALEVLANLRLFILFLYHVKNVMNLTNYLQFSVSECVIFLAYAWVGVS